MFRCKNCEKPAAKMIRVTLETRPVVYYTTILIQQRTNKKLVLSRLLAQEERDEYKIMKYKVIKSLTSQGSEIIKETQVCEDCAKKLQKIDE